MCRNHFRPDNKLDTAAASKAHKLEADEHDMIDPMVGQIVNCDAFPDEFCVVFIGRVDAEDPLSGPQRRSYSRFNNSTWP